MTAVERSRTYQWDDPSVVAEAGASMSGLEFLEAISRGELPRPPIAATLGFEASEFADGEATFFLTPAEFHYNPIGSVHGGVTATLLDSALGCAVQTRLPAGTAYTTLELKVNYIRAITATTGRLRCHARVIHVGGRIATADAQVTDADGRLYAHATTTCLITRFD